MQTALRVEFESSVSSKVIGNVRESRKVYAVKALGSLSRKSEKSHEFDSIRRLQNLPLHQDAFHKHMCLHFTIRQNSLQGLNTLIKVHFAKNAHQTKRIKVNQNRELLYDLHALTELMVGSCRSDT